MWSILPPVLLKNSFTPAEVSHDSGGCPGVECIAPVCNAVELLSAFRHSCNLEEKEMGDQMSQIKSSLLHYIKISCDTPSNKYVSKWLF